MATQGTASTGTVRATPIRLADGRELVYYDAPDEQGALPPRGGADLVDLRPAAAPATASEIRRDPLTGEWVTVASHRQGRTFLPPADECPLCPSRDGRLSEIPAADYDVVVFENRFPSYATHADPVGSLDDGGRGIYERRVGDGRCEVVCFTSDHDSSFAQLTTRQARAVIDVWATRTEALGALPGVAQVFPFENRGQEIGVTLSHPHGQIYGYPFVTPRTRQMLGEAAGHLERTGRDLFGDVLAAELQAGERVVIAGEHWTAFVPAAARWPVEVQLFPHRQVPDLPALDDSERDELAEIYLDLLRRADAYFDVPLPYMAAWHQAPVREGRDLAWCHLQLISIRRTRDKLKYLAGSESVMGAFINDAAPERIAERLREVQQ